MATLNSPTLGKHSVEIVGLEVDPGDIEVSSEDITDSTATGRAVITAASQAAARTAIGAGTSNLTLGTSSSTAKAGDYTPDWGDVSGKPAVIAAGADQATARAAIGAGTSNLTVGTGASDAKAGNYQPTWAQVTGKPAVIGAGATEADARTAIGAGTSSLALGSTASTAAAGNHTHPGLLTGSAATVADATDEASAVTQLNALLALLRTRGVVSS